MYGQRTVLRWHSSVSEWLTAVSYTHLYVYFLGEDEITAGVVSCKDMRTGEQVKLPRAEAVEKAKAFVESDRQKPVICEK